MRVFVLIQHMLAVFAAALLAFAGAQDDAEAPSEMMHELALAARLGSEDMVRSLLTTNVELDAMDALGKTALHHAAQAGQASTARVLCEAGASLGSSLHGWANGRTPLHAAAEAGHADVARVLIEAGAAVDATNADGDTPLHAASYHGEVEMVALLLNALASVDAADHLGRRAVHYVRRQPAGTSHVCGIPSECTMHTARRPAGLPPPFRLQLHLSSPPASYRRRFVATRMSRECWRRPERTSAPRRPQMAGPRCTSRRTTAHRWNSFAFC